MKREKYSKQSELPSCIEPYLPATTKARKEKKKKLKMKKSEHWLEVHHDNTQRAGWSKISQGPRNTRDNENMK